MEKPEPEPTPTAVQITLQAGSNVGVQLGSVYALHPPDATPDEATATVEVVSVEEDHAVATVVSGSVGEGYVATCVFRPPAIRNLRVHVTGSGPGADAIQSAIRRLDAVELSSADDADRHVVLEGPLEARVLNAWGDTVRGGIRGATAEKLAEAVARPLVMAYFGRQIARMEPAKTDMRVTLRSVPANKTVVKLGDPVQFEVTCNRDAEILLLSMTSDGDVSILYPNQYSTARGIRAGETLLFPSPADSGKFWFEATEPTGEVLTKVFAFEGDTTLFDLIADNMQGDLLRLTIAPNWMR